jgi:hypothetical protein
MQAAMLASAHGGSHCLIDFSNAISLLSEVAGLEQTIRRRHANLHDYSHLVKSAMATALYFNKSNLALEWLEQGRAWCGISLTNSIHQLTISLRRIQTWPIASYMLQVL